MSDLGCVEYAYIYINVSSVYSVNPQSFALLSQSSTSSQQEQQYCLLGIGLYNKAALYNYNIRYNITYFCNNVSSAF